jgi:hypothetical protein
MVLIFNWAYKNDNQKYLDVGMFLLPNVGFMAERTTFENIDFQLKKLSAVRVVRNVQMGASSIGTFGQLIPLSDLIL